MLEITSPLLFSFYCQQNLSCIKFPFSKIRTVVLTMIKGLIYKSLVWRLTLMHLISWPAHQFYNCGWKCRDFKCLDINIYKCFKDMTSSMSLLFSYCIEAAIYRPFKKKITLIFYRAKHSKPDLRTSAKQYSSLLRRLPPGCSCKVGCCFI